VKRAGAAAVCWPLAGGVLVPLARADELLVLEPGELGATAAALGGGAEGVAGRGALVVGAGVRGHG
jgi:hypothetical protein